MLQYVLQLAANGLSLGVGYALVALGLTIVFGVLHVINFAHGEVFMFGALTALLGTKAGLPYLAVLPLSALTGILVGIVIDWLCVRPLLMRSQDKTVVLLSTFAMSIILFEAVFVLYGAQPENVPGVGGVLELGGVAITWQRVVVLAAGMFMLVALEYVLKKTRFGVEVRAAAQSAFAAQLVGINLPRINSLIFALASAIAGVGGALMAPVIVYSPAMGQAVITKTFVVVVVGGLGSIRGAVIAGLLLGLLEAFGGALISEGLASAAIYALLLAVLLFRPQGLLGKRI